MNDEKMKELYETFKLSERKGQGGMVFKYVPNEDVINRMNKVFKGNWSTQVKDKDVVDDQVVVEVEVAILDPEDGTRHIHAGFGSQQIMRYNSGPNQGKIIDIGNAYKGALAKAIVNACTRWGVGLFKERNPYESDNITMVADSEEDFGSVPVMAPPTPQAPQTVPTPQPPQQSASPQQNVPVPPPAANIPNPNPAPTVPVPNVPSADNVKEVTHTFAPPVVPNQPVQGDISLTQTTTPTPPQPQAASQPAPMPKIPAPSTEQSAATTMPFSKKEESLGGISDVQKVALNGILSMNNANYEELATEAFTSKNINKPVPPKENLSYEEAVVVIKYGNDKYRNNR